MVQYAYRQWAGVHTNERQPMDTYKVWHVDARTPLTRELHGTVMMFGLKPEQAQAIFAGTDPCLVFTHVADVQVDPDKDVYEKLDICFEKTNHIDRSWTQNENVRPLVQRARSTSVGDVIEEPTGKRWIVASMGFTEIPRE